MTNDYNGHVTAPLVDQVAGDEGEPYVAEPSIFVVGRFDGGPPDHTQVREVTVSIPVGPHDKYADYAVAIVAAVREIGQLGYAPGYQAPDVHVGTGAAPSWADRT